MATEVKPLVYLVTGLVERCGPEGSGVLGRWSSGAGKDTLADALRAAYEEQVVTIALADPIKRIVANVYDLHPDYVWGSRKNEPLEGWPLGDGSTGELLTSRYAQVELGTRWGRGCSEHTWTKYLARLLRRLIEEPNLHYSRSFGVYPQGVLRTTKAYVVTDVRFKSELMALRQLLGLHATVVTVRVRRWTNNPPPPALNIHHPSEADLVGVPDDVFDWVVANDGSIEDLSVEALEYVRAHTQ